RPSGPALEALATGAQPADAATLQALVGEGQAVATRQVLSGPYAPVDTAAMVADGLGGELTAQIARADALTSQLLQVRPDPRTWVSDDTLGQSAVAAVPPLSWEADPAFVSALLDGLATSPIVSGVTLDGLFTSPVAQGRQRVRALASAPIATDRVIAGGPIRSARRRLEAFGTFL